MNIYELYIGEDKYEEQEHILLSHQKELTKQEFRKMCEDAIEKIQGEGTNKDKLYYSGKEIANLLIHDNGFNLLKPRVTFLSGGSFNEEEDERTFLSTEETD